MAKIYHAEIFGTREKKYNWLEKNDINSVNWKELKPQSEFYLFIKSDSSLLAKYNELPKVTEIFPVNSVGIVTSRDHFVIDDNKEKLIKRLQTFLDSTVPEEVIKSTYDLKDTKNWSISNARKQLRKDTNWKDEITKILYRPFDSKWIVYDDILIERSRKDVLKNMVAENIAITIGRQFSVIGSDNYDIVFVSDSIVDFNLYRRGGELVFPLYLYPDTTKEDLFSGSASGEKKPNIAPEIFEQLKTNFKIDITAEQIFYYIYAVLYSNTYRTKYAEFLKIDFPRIPFTKDYKLFIKLGELGKELADLHLLKSKKLDRPIAKFDVDGSNEVDKVNYDNAGKVYINKEQYFEPVPDEVWNYHIGGYQVCHKWLKDRKGRKLTLEERETYCKIVTALYHTIELQKQIDELYEGVEK